MDELVRRLIKAGIMPKKEGSFVLSSGQKSDIYFDLKAVCGSHPGIRAELADRLYHQFPQRVTCVAGSGHGGIPLAATISTMYELKLATIRSQRKEYGTGKCIDGYHPESADIIALVDDVFTRGDSLRESISILRQETESTRISCHVVINRNDNGLGLLSLLPSNVTETYMLTHLFTMEDFFC